MNGPAHTPGHNARPPKRIASGAPTNPESLERHPDYREGWRLFQGGYPWEAHEAWEDVWRTLPPGSAERVLTSALIRLAAAAVKARQRNRVGLEHHLTGAAAHLGTLGPKPVGGILPTELARWIGSIHHEAWLDAGPDEPGPIVELPPGACPGVIG